jgi:hypothetical protein
MKIGLDVGVAIDIDSVAPDHHRLTVAARQLPGRPYRDTGARMNI